MVLGTGFRPDLDEQNTQTLRRLRKRANPMEQRQGRERVEQLRIDERAEAPPLFCPGHCVRITKEQERSAPKSAKRPRSDAAKSVNADCRSASHTAPDVLKPSCDEHTTSKQPVCFVGAQPHRARQRQLPEGNPLPLNDYWHLRCPATIHSAKMRATLSKTQHSAWFIRQRRRSERQRQPSTDAEIVMMMAVDDAR